MADINALVTSYEKLSSTLVDVDSITKSTTGAMAKLNMALKSVNKQLILIDKNASNASVGLKKLGDTNASKKLKTLGESANKATKNIKKLVSTNTNKKLNALGNSAVKATKGINELAKTNANTKLNSLKDSAEKTYESLKKLSSVNVSDNMNNIDKSTKKAFGGNIKQSIGSVIKKISSIKKSAVEASGQIINLAKKIVNLDGIKKGMDLVDSFTITNEKVKLINGGSTVDQTLQNKLFTSANNSRSNYEDTVNNVANMKSVAGKSFSSTDELIGFTELLQKGVKIGGTSSEQQSSSMSQLTQAMSTGSLGGDAFQSIIASAPEIAEAISKYTGKSNEELMTIASQGLLTSDILKNAMFASSEQINEDFNGMPMTFADIWNQLKNGALQSISAVLGKISELVNSDGFNQFISAISIGFEYVAKAAGWLVDTIINGWDLIGPVLAYIGGVLLVAMITHLWAMIPPLIAQSMAWLVAAWPILLLVGIIALAITAARQFGVSWEEIAGYVGGVIGGFVTLLYNNFVFIWNFVAEFINFLGNAFNDPISAIKIMFLNLVVHVLGFIETMARGIEDVINKIPGVEVTISGQLQGLKDKAINESAKLKSEADWKEFVKTKDFMDFSDGVALGQKEGKDFKNKLNVDVGSVTDTLTGNKFAGFDDLGTSNNPISTTSVDEKQVNIADEDLKYLRDIAERDYINKLSTATLAPNISVQFGDVHETADADKVAKRVQTIMQEEIAIMSEGVYAYG